MKKTVISLAVILVLAGAAVIQQIVTAQTAALPTEEAPKIGYLAPAFELQTLDGGAKGIARGELEKPILMNFWASWCDPCRLEAPVLADIYMKYGDQLEIYGVNGTEFDQMEGVESFVQQYQVKFPVLLDPESKVFNQYKVQGFPTTFLIDRNGVIQDIVLGMPPEHEEFEKKVLKLLK